jgi:hypothetical protein
VIGPVRKPGREDPIPLKALPLADLIRIGEVVEAIEIELTPKAPLARIARGWRLCERFCGRCQRSRRGLAGTTHAASSAAGLKRDSPRRQLDQLWARDAFSVTAARTRAFNASSSIFSPSWKSMARLVLPSRLELKRPDGSSSAAPLAKVIFTTFL